MRQTKAVQVKHLQIGGGAPVLIQSMTKTDTSDVGATVVLQPSHDPVNSDVPTRFIGQ